MSDEMKNCCPPETTAPKMEVHDASEGSKDIKPKLVSTAHKKLTQDEFQRKVAMAARISAAEDMEKDAGIGAVLGGIGSGLRALGTKGLWAPISSAGRALGAKFPSLLKYRMPSAKALASGRKGVETWANYPARFLHGGVKALEHPITWGGSAIGAGLAAVPYVGGALERVGGALGGTVGQQAAQNFGGAIGGGLLGAGLGAVGGALMPGQEEYEDENGNVRKRSRGMLSGALRGAGMGGIAGGLGGAAMDHFGEMSAAQEFGATVAKTTR